MGIIHTSNFSVQGNTNDMREFIRNFKSCPQIFDIREDLGDRLEIKNESSCAIEFNVSYNRDEHKGDDAEKMSRIFPELLFHENIFFDNMYLPSPDQPLETIPPHRSRIYIYKGGVCWINMSFDLPADNPNISQQ